MTKERNRRYQACHRVRGVSFGQSSEEERGFAAAAAAGERENSTDTHRDNRAHASIAGDDSLQRKPHFGVACLASLSQRLQTSINQCDPHCVSEMEASWQTSQPGHSEVLRSDVVFQAAGDQGIQLARACAGGPLFLLVIGGREGWPICWESVQVLVGSMALIQRSHAMDALVAMALAHDWQVRQS